MNNTKECCQIFVMVSLITTTFIIIHKNKNIIVKRAVTNIQLKYLHPQTSELPNARLIIAVTLDGSARKLVTVRSALQLTNFLHCPVDVRLENSALRLGGEQGFTVALISPLCQPLQLPSHRGGFYFILFIYFFFFFNQYGV